MTASEATVARVAILDRRVARAAPVSAMRSALYGHVYDAELQPVSAYTVFLVDARMPTKRLWLHLLPTVQATS